MTTPATDLAALPWRDTPPDAEGYWWFRSTKDLESPSAHVGCWARYVQRWQVEGTAPLPSYLVAATWVRDQMQCCPVVGLCAPDPIGFVRAFSPPDVGLGPLLRLVDHPEEAAALFAEETP